MPHYRCLRCLYSNGGGQKKKKLPKPVSVGYHSLVGSSVHARDVILAFSLKRTPLHSCAIRVWISQASQSCCLWKRKWGYSFIVKEDRTTNMLTSVSATVNCKVPEEMYLSGLFVMIFGEFSCHPGWSFTLCLGLPARSPQSFVPDNQ